MPIKIITQDTVKNHLAEAGHADVVRVYAGDADHALSVRNAETIGATRVVPVMAGQYANSEGKLKRMQRIRNLAGKVVNAAQNPAQADVDALVGEYFVDVTRRAQEMGDLTSLFATELDLPDAPATVSARYLEQYVGEMQVVQGTNDSVPLIEQDLGVKDTFDLSIKALGWKDSLANMLFNRIHAMDKVTDAAVAADIDKRNAATIGMIVGATFVATQKQAADTTTGATFDIKNYNTLRKAIKKLRGLKDPKTGRTIRVPGISILCNSVNAWDIERVVRGQLTNGAANGTLTTQNAQALPINNIIVYDQGRTDGKTWGKKTLSYPGVTAGTCYVFVPREYFWVVNKRGLQTETGRGSTLQLSTEEFAWYRVDGAYYQDFLGSSYPGTALGGGYGAIIEVTLPADS